MLFRSIYVQGTKDLAHPRPDLDRFVAAYRKAGGEVDLRFVEGEGEAFVKKNPKSPNSLRAIADTVEFVHARLG